MKRLPLAILFGVVFLTVLCGYARAEITYRTISGNPLTIYVAEDLSLQIKYYGQSDHQVYSPSEYLGSSGFLAWINGTVYSPDFDNHPSPGSQCDTFTAWSYVSQTGPTGSGTQGSPWKVTTVADAGSSGIRITETVSYVDGQEYFRLDREICNSSGSSVSTTVFHAADFYLQGSDSGYGYYNASNGSVGGYNSSMDWYEIFAPITPASAYQEGYYGDIWHAIATGPTSHGPGFNNTLDPSDVDNGAGLQWSDVSIPNGDCATISMWWSFGVNPEIPPTPTPTVVETPTPAPTVPPVKTPTPAGDVTPTPANYLRDAEAIDIWLVPEGVQAGQSGNVYGRFHNLTTWGGSPAGAAFDARIIVIRPDSTSSYAYITDWGFTAAQYRTLYRSDYSFTQAGRYTVEIEIYAPGAKDAGWPVSMRYDSRSEDFTILVAPSPSITPRRTPTPAATLTPFAGATPTPAGYVLDAEAVDVWLDPAVVTAGEQADVYARYRNLTRQDGEPAPASFDVRIVVWYPDGRYASGSIGNWDFSAGQTKNRRLPSVHFTQAGTYTVIGEIYDQEGRESGWAVSHRLDAHREGFDVRSPTTQTPSPQLDSGDYDGDGTSDIALFRPGSGLWAVRGVTRTYFGSSSDTPVSGDYDGDGTSDIGIFRSRTGLWAIKDVGRGYFGSAGDKAVPGDYNGDGRCDLGIFRASIGLWWIQGVTRAYFGGSGDKPVPGYFDGDTTKDICIFRGSSGLWAIRGVTRVYFGSSSDTVMPGDYDGDGIWEVGIFRPAPGLWAIRGVTRVYFGASSDSPVPADYAGSGADNIGIYREISGLWAVRGITRAYFGSTGDIPVTR